MRDPLGIICVSAVVIAAVLSLLGSSVSKILLFASIVAFGALFMIKLFWDNEEEESEIIDVQPVYFQVQETRYETAIPHILRFMEERLTMVAIGIKKEEGGAS